MNLALIEENVAALDASSGFDLIFGLLAAYGMPRASIARLRNGSLNQAHAEDEVLWRAKVYYRYLPPGTGDVHLEIDGARVDDRIRRARPRFLVAHDSERLVALDTKTGDSLDVELSRLSARADFFLPWIGVEKAQLEALHYADIKAAEKMARLYDEIRRVNEFDSPESLHTLNVFFTRLLFCFFAEDTGIFARSSVTQSIASRTSEDGSDLQGFLDTLFATLDTPMQERDELPAYMREFGYVNGRLFRDRLSVPVLSTKARSIIIECGTLDWSEINPDIFGSMMQAVVHPGERAGLGMHYTSVQNIMRVLRPLFLDDLAAAYEAAADDAKKLRRLLERLSAIKVFDPACGSGNFLVIAYKELRRMEHRVLERLRDLSDDPRGSGLFEESRIKLDHFCGIEIDDFAHEVARLALWIAKHQMNAQFEELFGPRLQMIPLTEAGRVVCGNAARTDWEAVCSVDPGDEVYVCGNPPYLGAKLLNAEQKGDLAAYFGAEPYSSNLDYISLWFLRGADYAVATGATVGFVSTNSICQGEHVALLFPKLFARGVEIAFAHTSFPWANNAKANAGVTCIVVGLAQPRGSDKALYGDGTKRLVPHIGPYLRPSLKDTVIEKQSVSISGLPAISSGNKPIDGGHLLLTRAEMERILEGAPEAQEFIRRYVGADEFLSGSERWCIWIGDSKLDEAMRIPLLRDRLEAVREFRLKSVSSGTRKLARLPNRFHVAPHRDANAIIIPSHSSERREYVPMGFLTPETVISNAASAIYGAEPWLFGLVQSRMHMVWLRAVGGRIKTDFRYSATLVYNTFPVPRLSEEEKLSLAVAGLRVLAAREQFSERTLAELYDPDKTPELLLAAHRHLDEAVDALYGDRAFTSDDERLSVLFEMYEHLTSRRQALLNA